MGLLDNLTGILAQYASGSAPAGDASTHFEQVPSPSIRGP
jgi:hypothetical protein